MPRLWSHTSTPARIRRGFVGKGGVAHLPQSPWTQHCLTPLQSAGSQAPPHSHHRPAPGVGATGTCTCTAATPPPRPCPATRMRPGPTLVPPMVCRVRSQPWPDCHAAAWQEAHSACHHHHGVQRPPKYHLNPHPGTRCVSSLAWRAPRPLKMDLIGTSTHEPTHTGPGVIPLTLPVCPRVPPPPSRAHRVVIFAKTWCPYCLEVRRTFDGLGVPYQLFNIDAMPNGGDIHAALKAAHGQTTVPYVFINKVRVPVCLSVCARPVCVFTCVRNWGCAQCGRRGQWTALEALSDQPQLSGQLDLSRLSSASRPQGREVPPPTHPGRAPSGHLCMPSFLSSTFPAQQPGAASLRTLRAASSF